MGTINSSMQAVQQAQSDLGHVDNLPPLGHDLVSRPLHLSRRSDRAVFGMDKNKPLHIFPSFKFHFYLQ